MEKLSSSHVMENRSRIKFTSDQYVTKRIVARLVDKSSSILNFDDYRKCHTHVLISNISDMLVDH